MNWKTIKKVLIPVIIIKILVFVFVVFKSDLITISREFTYTGNYEQGIGNDTVVQGKQRLIKIVRNEEDRGITIRLRKKKNVIPAQDRQSEPSNPIID